jgi:hypothetical protein
MSELAACEGRLVGDQSDSVLRAIAALFHTNHPRPAGMQSSRSKDKMEGDSMVRKRSRRGDGKGGRLGGEIDGDGRRLFNEIERQ